MDYILGVEHSLSGRAWRARGGDARTALALAQRFGFPEIVGRLLACRGVGEEDCERFLAPTLRDGLPDPSHLRDMDRAVARLVDAIRNDETIAIFGDYDVDGATSSALLKRFFAAVGARAIIYVPDRQREGYGPNEAALAKLQAQGARVVVTVDCGITAHRALEAAAARGLDVIVVDHHLGEPSLPQAYAVIDPNRLDEESVHGVLAAVGVTFLLVTGVNRALRQAGWYQTRPAPDLLQWLDLVALGTVCDIVPLTGVNRALVAQGLKVMRRRANTGIAALSDVAGIGEKLDAYHAGFILGPRVNAGGRVGEADLGARLLSTDDPDRGARARRSSRYAQRRAAADRGGCARRRGRAGRKRAARADRLCGGRGLASRRHRHRRQPAEGSLQPSRLRRRAAGRRRPRLGALGRRFPDRSGDHRRTAGRAADQWRRPRDGGGTHR